MRKHGSAKMTAHLLPASIFFCNYPCLPRFLETWGFLSVHFRSRKRSLQLWSEEIVSLILDLRWCRKRFYPPFRTSDDVKRDFIRHAESQMKSPEIDLVWINNNHSINRRVAMVTVELQLQYQLPWQQYHGGSTPNRHKCTKMYQINQDIIIKIKIMNDHEWMILWENGFPSPALPRNSSVTHLSQLEGTI